MADVFLPLSQQNISWMAMATASNGDVYASTAGDAPSGNIYKRAGGINNFDLYAKLPPSGYGKDLLGIAITLNGDIYVGANGDGIYKQAGGSGSFALEYNAANSWEGMAAASNGDVYACADDPNAVYKQSGGSGSFTDILTGIIGPMGIAIAPNGDIYVASGYSGIFKQTGGSGSFVNVQAGTYRAISAAPNGDIYACIQGGDIYRQVYGSNTFVAMGQTSRSWTAISATPNGDVYACEYGGDIYEALNLSPPGPTPSSNYRVPVMEHFSWQNTVIG